jgi:hypothetical protein
MNSFQQRFAALTDARLASVTEATIKLVAELSELNRLRGRLRKAQISAQGSWRLGRRKRTAGRFRNLRSKFLAASTRR